jgi:hypothetical protein
MPVIAVKYYGLGRGAGRRRSAICCRWEMERRGRRRRRRRATRLRQL